MRLVPLEADCDCRLKSMTVRVGMCAPIVSPNTDGRLRDGRAVLVPDAIYARLVMAFFQLLLLQPGKLGLQLLEILLTVPGLDNDSPGILKLLVGASH